MTFAIIGCKESDIGRPYYKDVTATPYGDAQVAHIPLENGKECLLISRYGFMDKKDARDVNYRSNIYALSVLGATHVISLSSVGTCDYAHKLEDVFSSSLNDALERVIHQNGFPYSGRVIYAGTDGPRFETGSEVRMFRIMGAQVIGMALLPEAPLAAERGLHYASIGIISNYATGMSFSVREADIDAVGAAQKSVLLAALINFIESLPG